MKAAVLDHDGRLQVRTVADPALAAGQTLVQVERAGICGTDLKILHGAIPVSRPRIMGHEVVGRLLDLVVVGPDITLAAGTRVLVDPGIDCGGCRVCRADRPQLCPHGCLRGRDCDGGFAELMAVDPAKLHVVPTSMALDAACVLQVLATCVHAQTLVEVFPGQRAVVVGLGVCGLLHVRLLRARGLTDILAVTSSRWKHELAYRFGASAVAPPAQAAQVLADFTEGLGADLVVESVGRESALNQAVELAGPGGTVLVFGTTPGHPRVSTYQWYFKELRLVNSRSARPRDFTTAIDLVTSAGLDPAALVTERFALPDAPAAFAACEQREQLKVILQMF